MSQLKDSTYSFVNKQGYKDLIRLNKEYPNLLWRSHIWEFARGFVVAYYIKTSLVLFGL